MINQHKHKTETITQSFVMALGCNFEHFYKVSCKHFDILHFIFGVINATDKDIKQTLEKCSSNVGVII